MFTRRFLRNVIIKALLLFLACNVLFAAWNPVATLGSISVYNLIFPGRLRFPFGEDPQHAYNLSLYSLEAMFASHVLAGTPAHSAQEEYRVLLLGDSSVWGTLLRPEQTLAGQLDAANLQTCHGQQVRVYNLGYPTLSLFKDLMILREAQRYQPDLVVWLVTLESFPVDRQFSSSIVANNPYRVKSLIQSDGLSFSLEDPALERPTFWIRTIIGQRRWLADMLRLQIYGVLWAATGIDQVYPEQYPAAQRDLEADDTFNNWKPSVLLEGQLAFDVLDAGMRQVTGTRMLLVNEPILISAGKNSDIRYNFYYPRWAYDLYRKFLQERSQQMSWNYLDLWNLVPEKEFTNSAIHMTPEGTAQLAQRIGGELLKESCR